MKPRYVTYDLRHFVNRVWAIEVRVEVPMENYDDVVDAVIAHAGVLVDDTLRSRGLMSVSKWSGFRSMDGSTWFVSRAVTHSLN